MKAMPYASAISLKGAHKGFNMHYYQFNIADYKKDTDHLTPIEHYIYRTLIDRYYLDEKPIPKITQSVMRRLRLDTKEHEIMLKNVLEDFFYECEDGYRHHRIDKEIKLYHEKAEKNRKNGKKGGRPPSKEPKRTQVVNVGLPEESQTNPNQEPLTINQEPLTINQLKALSDKSDCVNEIFGYWVSVMNKNSLTKLTPKRKTCVQARLKEGYTVEQIKHAIDGCAKSPHHMGQNDAGTIYDDLTLICRSGDRLEQFANNVAQVVPTTNNFNQPKKPYTGLAADDISWVAGMEDLY